jgi:hypothetical protein
MNVKKIYLSMFSLALVNLAAASANAAQCDQFNVEGRWQNRRGVVFEIRQRGCSSGQLIDVNGGYAYEFNLQGKATAFPQKAFSGTMAQSVEIQSELRDSRLTTNLTVVSPLVMGPALENPLLKYTIRTETTLVNPDRLSFKLTSIRIKDNLSEKTPALSKAFVRGANMILRGVDYVLPGLTEEECSLTRIQ